jgi:hypothetical protein
MTHTLTFTTRLDRARIPALGGTVNLLIQLTAPSHSPGSRLPLNLAAMVDRSGSMHGPTPSKRCTSWSTRWSRRTGLPSSPTMNTSTPFCPASLSHTKIP